VFDTVGPRFGDRNGGYTRIIRTGWNKGDGATRLSSNCWQREDPRRKKEKRAEAALRKLSRSQKGDGRG